MLKKREPTPGDLIRIKQLYSGKGHPDDHIVGLVIASHDDVTCIMFTERGGFPAFEPCSRGEVFTYYECIKP
jgi:hypothetical protein